MAPAPTASPLVTSLLNHYHYHNTYPVPVRPARPATPALPSAEDMAALCALVAPSPTPKRRRVHTEPRPSPGAPLRPPPRTALPPTPAEMEDYVARQLRGDAGTPPPSGIPKHIPLARHSMPRSMRAPSPLRASISISDEDDTDTPTRSEPPAILALAEQEPPANSPPPAHCPAPPSPASPSSAPSSPAPPPPATPSPVEDLRALREVLARLVAGLAADDLRAELASFVAAMTKRREIVIQTARLQAIADELAAALTAMGDSQWEEALRPMRRYTVETAEAASQTEHAGPISPDDSHSHSQSQSQSHSANGHTRDASTATENPSPTRTARASTASAGTFGTAPEDTEARRQSLRTALDRMASWKPQWVESVLDREREREKREQKEHKEQEEHDRNLDKARAASASKTKTKTRQTFPPMPDDSPLRRTHTERRSVVFGDAARQKDTHPSREGHRRSASSGNAAVPRRGWLPQLPQRTLGRIFRDDREKRKVSGPVRSEMSVWED